MTEKQLNFLLDLKKKKKHAPSKQDHDEVDDIISDLKSYNLISKMHNSNTLEIVDRISFDKLIELKSLSEFEKWYSDKDKIMVDNSLKIYGNNYGIQSSNSDFIRPTIQTKVNTTPKEPHKKSWIEILYWVIGIIVGITIIYEFFLKSLF